MKLFDEFINQQLNFKNFKNVGSWPHTPPYSFDGPKEYAEKGLPLHGAFLLRVLFEVNLFW